MLIPFFIEEPTPLKTYALEFLIEYAGYACAPLETPQGAVVYYGNHPPAEFAVSVPERPADRIWYEVLRGHPRCAVGRLPFDVVSAAAAFLTDNVNPRDGLRDRHDRLGYDASFQAQNGYGDRAVVNRYVEMIRQLLEAAVGPGIPRWPAGKRAAIALSHDLDRIGPSGRMLGSLRRPGSATAIAIEALLFPSLEEFQFQSFVNREASMGFRSTFFVASVGRRATSCREDVRYSLEDPRLHRAVQFVRERGFEVALHASYDAFRSEERFRDEKVRLSVASGCEVTGVRHHYWHLGPDTERSLLHHERAGFEYDSSLSWNDHVGLRRSVALPYYPWHSRENRRLRVLQLPVLAMDAHLFLGMTEGAVERQVEILLQGIGEVADFNGAAVINWHTDRCHPKSAGYEKWGQAYFEVLSQLAGMKDVWVTSLGEITKWWHKRERQLGASARPSQRVLAQTV